jgi:MATE family multidrug resistance protein
MKTHYIKQTIAVALPVTVTQLIGTVSGFVGMAFLAQLGHHILAASALLYAAQTMIFVISISPLFSVSVLISRAFGAGKVSEIGNIVQQAWALSLLLAVVIIVLYLSIKPILLACGQSLELVNDITPFFHTAVYGVPATMICVATSQFLLGIRRQKLVMLLMAVQMTLNALASYALILGHWGMPKLGVAGWGWAYVITTWFSLLLYVIVLLVLKEFQQFSIFKTHMRNNWKHLKDLFRFGWPIMVQTGGELLSFGFVTMMVGWLGTTSLAAMQVVTQYLMLLVIPSFGYTMAGAVLVGHSMGAKQYHQAKMFGYVSLATCVSTIVLLGALLNIFPAQFSHIFLHANEPHYAEILSLIKKVFFIIALSQIFDAVRNSLTGALRGLLDMKYPMIVGLVCIWLIRVPCSYLFGFVLHGGVVGMAFGGIIGMSIAAALIFARWHYKTKNLQA